MQKLYNIIYADPPWRYKDKSLHRGGAERHYKTMNLQDIKNLDVNSIAADNSMLFMWATLPLIREAFELIYSWNFTFKTCAFVWVKSNKRVCKKQLEIFQAKKLDDFMGNGHWTRANAEICLLATKGRPKKISNSVRQIIYSPISDHSKKPSETRDRIIELCGDLPRIELFSRQEIAGWDNWGNKIETKVNLPFLNKPEIPHINKKYLNKSNIIPTRSVEDKNLSEDVIIICNKTGMLNIGYYNFEKNKWSFYIDFEIPDKFTWYYKPKFHK